MSSFGNLTEKPIRIVHCKKEAFDTYIGRPSVLGNPFIIGRDGSREDVVAKFEEYARDRMKTDPVFKAAILACRGKILGCWCGRKLCHGTIIRKIVNEFNGEMSE